MCWQYLNNITVLLYIGLVCLSQLVNTTDVNPNERHYIWLVYVHLWYMCNYGVFVARMVLVWKKKKLNPPPRPIFEKKVMGNKKFFIRCLSWHSRGNVRCPTCWNRMASATVSKNLGGSGHNLSPVYEVIWVMTWNRWHKLRSFQNK